MDDNGCFGWLESWFILVLVDDGSECLDCICLDGWSKGSQRFLIPDDVFTFT